MESILYWTIYSFIWLLKRLLQLASVVVLVYWIGFCIYLFFAGLGDNSADDTELIAFALMLGAPPFLAAFLWKVNEWMKFDD